MTGGFAVPHAKDTAIKDAAVFVSSRTTPLLPVRPSFDEKPVDVAIALLVPDGEAENTHIGCFQDRRSSDEEMSLSLCLDGSA